MSNTWKLFLSMLFAALIYCPTAIHAENANFANPVVKDAKAGCVMENLRAERFASEILSDERVKLCAAIEKISGKLNSTEWSPELSAELKNIWQVFAGEAVTFRPMPQGASARVAAMAEPFPAGSAQEDFAACVYVRPEKSHNAVFFQLLLHELRHVFDFHEVWKNKDSINSLEVERRAYLLMSRLSEETPKNEKFSGIPKLWKESWRRHSSAEIAQKREKAVEKFLRKNKLYRTYVQEPNKQTLDFSYLKNNSASNNQSFAAAYVKKDSARLPDRPALPQINSVIQQSVRETSFNLEKPKNPLDENEILRVALSNEKKLYYGMENFVYDQKLNLQCWRKGKVSASFAENKTIARAGNGGALFQASSTASQANEPPCRLNYQEIKTDFTETFWASPALEKMPIKFVGFYEVEGKTLARYTVYQPDRRLYNQLASEYSLIKPFRVFVGTIFISPEDGQIVKFWGTSFPEDNVTGADSQKVWGGYSVTALRQKLDIDKGLWVTVFVGTAAVADLKGKFQPFSYTVKFENFRQSTSDVKILDDEEAVGDITSK